MVKAIVKDYIDPELLPTNVLGEKADLTTLSEEVGDVEAERLKQAATIYRNSLTGTPQRMHNVDLDVTLMYPTTVKLLTDSMPDLSINVEAFGSTIGDAINGVTNDTSLSGCIPSPPPHLAPELLLTEVLNTFLGHHDLSRTRMFAEELIKEKHSTPTKDGVELGDSLSPY